jgi:hypothetical protein
VPLPRCAWVGVARRLAASTAPGSQLSRCRAAAPGAALPARPGARGPSLARASAGGAAAAVLENAVPAASRYSFSEHPSPCLVAAGSRLQAVSQVFADQGRILYRDVEPQRHLHSHRRRCPWTMVDEGQGAGSIECAPAAAGVSVHEPHQAMSEAVTAGARLQEAIDAGLAVERPALPQNRWRQEILRRSQ